MKKHPVDDLFRRRLAELEKAPSENAWEKIQTRNIARRKSPLWIWYAAASILAILITGYVVWENADEDINPVAMEKVEIPEKKELEKSLSSESQHREAQKLSISEEPKTPITQKAHDSESWVGSLSIDKLDSDLQANTSEPIEIDPQIESKTSKVPDGTNPTPVLEKTNSISEISTIASVEKVVEPALTIVVTVETAESETDIKSRPSKFSRVFRQLKNARAGERVDWEEVGFNPKSLVARVDDRLRNKDISK